MRVRPPLSGPPAELEPLGDLEDQVEGRVASAHPVGVENPDSRSAEQ